MKVEELLEFKKDIKRLVKKYRSLMEDLLVVRKVLIIMPEERPPFSFQVEYQSDVATIIKVRNVACKSLKGTGVNSGLCLLYAYIKNEEKLVMIGLSDNNSPEDNDIQSMLWRFKSNSGDPINQAHP
jgi:hypothetical protein